MAEGVEDQKPDHINIKVVSGDGSEVYFKIKKSTPMKKMMDAYAEKQGKNVALIRFHFDGKNINPSDTPEKLGLQNEDTIEVNLGQVGGSHL